MSVFKINSKNSAHWSQISFYIFCTFPIVPTLQGRGLIAILFLAIQLSLVFVGKSKWQNKPIWFPLLQTLMIAFFVISLSYSEHFSAGLKFLERYVILFFGAWFLYLNRSYFNSTTLEKTLRFFSVIAALVTLRGMLTLFLDDIFFTPHSTHQLYYEIRTAMEKATELHPTYFSLILAIPILFIQYEWKHGKTKRSWRYASGIIAVILAAGLLLASSKMITFATAVSSIIIWSEGLTLKQASVRFAIASIAFTLLVISVRPLHERVSTMFKAVFSTEEKLANNPDLMRKLIYSSTFEVIQAHPWWGVGIGDQQSELNELYKKAGNQVAQSSQFNTHNQYLQIWLSSGIFALITFLLLLMSQLLVALVNKQYLHLSFVVLVMLAFTSESLLMRQDGVFVMAFFFPFFAYSTWQKKEGKIFINGKYVQQAFTGVQRFATELSDRLLNSSKKFELLTPSQPENLESTVIRFPFGSNTLWEQISLPAYLRLLGCPPLLNLCNTAPILYSNQFVTIHDVAFKHRPDWFSASFIRWYDILIPRILKNSRHVFTVSEFSRSEIRKYYGISKQEISILYNGVPTFHSERESEEPIVQGDYILSVGSVSDRKNQIALIDAYLNLDNPRFKLVIAGGIHEIISASEVEIKAKLEESSGILWIPDFKDDALVNLYKYALGSVYLSHYEGCGIPILESLSLGTPVLVSKIPVFEELYGDSVEYAIFTNPSELSDFLITWVERVRSTSSRWTDTSVLDAYSYDRSAIELQAIIDQDRKLNN